jgi:hypothetical protein
MIYDAVMTNFKVQCGLENMYQEAFKNNLKYNVNLNR